VLDHLERHRDVDRIDLVADLLDAFVDHAHTARPASFCQLAHGFDRDDVIERARSRSDRAERPCTGTDFQKGPARNGEPLAGSHNPVKPRLVELFPARGF